MNFKTVSLFSLLVYMTLLHTAEQNYTLAEKPYPKSLALFDLLSAGYEAPEKLEQVATRGNPETGASFIDMVIPMKDPHTKELIIDKNTGKPVELRAVCYGPERYVLPHSHNEDELFHVTRGACTIWTLEYDQHGVPYWIKSSAKTGETIQIPARLIHCLLASEQGLCMHVPWNDRTRSVDFVPTVKAPFERN